MKIFDTKELGKVLRQKRKEAGLTQHDLAQHAGVGVRFISELENGKDTAEIGKALHVFNILGFNMFIKSRNEN